MKMRYITSTFFITLIITLSGCSRTIEDYPLAIRWNNADYIGSDTFVSKEELGTEIGTITGKVQGFPAKNGYTNAYSKGDSFFEVKGLSVSEAIAVEENGQYRVLNKEQD